MRHKARRYHIGDAKKRPEKEKSDSEGIWDRFQLSTEIGPASNVLSEKRVLIVGTGSIGSEIALRLGGSRVSQLTLVDGDRVSRANIPHSIAFLNRHVGRYKVDVVREVLLAKFSDIDVTVKRMFAQQCNPGIFEQHDLIICAPDNDQTRWWVNFYAVKFGKQALFVGVSGPRAEWTGYTFLYKPRASACFVCFATGGEQSGAKEAYYATVPAEQDFEESRRKCGGENVSVPMLAPVVGTVSSYAASVALRSLANIEDQFTYTYLNIKQPRLITSDVKPVPTCTVCGTTQDYDLSSLQRGTELRVKD